MTTTSSASRSRPSVGAPKAPSVLRTSGTVNLRDAEGRVLASVPRGTAVTIIGSAPAAVQRQLESLRPGHAWVQVRLADGSPGFMARSLLSASGRASTAPSQMVNGNYTDLGYQHGVFSAAAAAADLDRLRRAGLTQVRIWAQPPNTTGDVNSMSARVGVLLRLAAERGMTLTVDLHDGHNNTRLANYLGHFTEELKTRISTIIGQNRVARNVIWSLGNELQAPDDPRGFATWYTSRVADMRRAGARTVSAELVPGAVGNDLSNPLVVAAMKQVVRAADVVSIHLYPNSSAAEASRGSGPYASDYGLFKAWSALARGSGKPLVVGEFGLQANVRTRQDLTDWLELFRSQGIRNVMIWQLMKDETGHLDNLSYDSVDGSSFQRELYEDGWLSSPGS
jgi:hypothetical protein